MKAVLLIACNASSPESRNSLVDRPMSLHFPGEVRATGRSRRSHSEPCQFEMRPSAPQLGQVQTIAVSRARPDSTVLFLHLKHLGAGGGCPVALETLAITLAWNCAKTRAGPFAGPIALVSSSTCLKSVMFIVCRFAFMQDRGGQHLPWLMVRSVPCHRASDQRLSRCR